MGIHVPILNYQDFDVSTIKIKKPVVVGRRRLYCLKTKEDTDIIIQSPRCIIPYSYVLFDDHKFQLDILSNNKTFTSLLTTIYEHIYHKIKRKCKLDLVKDDYYIKNYDDDNRRIRLRNDNVNNIGFYCSQKCNIPVNQLSRDEYVICIFTVDKFIISNEFTIFYLKVLQVKKCSETLQACLVVEEDTQNPFEKYQKMKKVGIPEGSIRHKMLLDGLLQSDIDEFFGANLSLRSSPHLPPPPPPPPPHLPPPPPPPRLSPSSSFPGKFQDPSQPHKFLGDIKSGNFKLKSVSKNPLTNMQPKKLPGVDRNKYVPSLDDILNAKKKLKNI